MEIPEDLEDVLFKKVKQDDLNNYLASHQSWGKIMEGFSKCKRILLELMLRWFNGNKTLLKKKF